MCVFELAIELQFNLRPLASRSILNSCFKLTVVKPNDATPVGDFIVGTFLYCHILRMTGAY